MKLKIRHTLFVFGLILFLISFLWFGRNQELYQLLLVGGLITSFITFIIILFKDDSIKSKFIWGGLILVTFFLNRLTERQLISFSFLIYINQNQAKLDRMNKILSNKREVIVFRTKITDEGNELNEKEILELRELQDKTDINIIAKYNNIVHYELWGFLDNRITIKYTTSGEANSNSGTRIKENWYF